MIKCELTLLDGSEATFEVKKKAKGSVLFDDVCRFINVVEKDYFGLLFKEDVLQNRWLNTNKKIKKQVASNDALRFQFAVKFYPTAPGTLKEDITRYQVCLQVRKDLTTNLTCNLDKLSILLSFWLQSEYEGDSQNPKVVQNCLKDFKDPPTESSSKEFIEKVLSLYRSRDGISSAAADTQFLITACKLPLYGVHFYNGKDTSDVKVLLGISAKGVIEKREGQAPILHSWPRIKNITYKKTNKFKVKLLRAPPNGDPRLKKTFKFDSEAQVHEIWSTAVNHHVFYRVDDKGKKSTSKDSTKKPKKKNSLLRRLSSRKKKPKTEEDVQVESANIKRLPPNVTRTSSLRKSDIIESSSISTSDSMDRHASAKKRYDVDDSSSSSSESNTEVEKPENSAPKTEEVYAEISKQQHQSDDVGGREYKEEDIMNAVIEKMDGEASGGSSTFLLTETIHEEDEELPDPAFLTTKTQFTGHYNQDTTFIPIQTHLEKMKESNPRPPLETDLDAEVVLSPKPRNMNGLSPQEFEIKLPEKEDKDIKPKSHHIIILEDTDIKEEYTEVWEEIEVGPPSPRKRKDVRFRSEEEEFPESLQNEDTIEENLDDEKSESSQERDFEFEKQNEQEQKSPLPTFDDLHVNNYWNAKYDPDYVENGYDTDTYNIRHIPNANEVVTEPQKTSIKEYVPKNIIESSEEGSDEDNESIDTLVQNDSILAELQRENADEVPQDRSEYDASNFNPDVEDDSATFKMPEIESELKENQEVEQETEINQALETTESRMYGDIRPDNESYTVSDESISGPYNDQKTWNTRFEPIDVSTYSLDDGTYNDPESVQQHSDVEEEEKHPLVANPETKINLELETTESQMYDDGDIKQDDGSYTVSDKGISEPYDDQKALNITVKPIDVSTYSFNNGTYKDPESVQQHSDVEEEEKHPLVVNPLEVYKQIEPLDQENEGPMFEIPSINLDSIDTMSNPDSSSTSTESLMQDQELVDVESEHESEKWQGSEMNENHSEQSDLEIDEQPLEKEYNNFDTTFDLPLSQYNGRILSLDYEPTHGLGEDLRLSLNRKIAAEGKLPGAGASTTAATIGDDDDLAFDELEDENLYEDEDPVSEKQDKDEANGSKYTEEKIESQKSPEDSTSRSTSLSDITNNTDELLLPDILERTWVEGAGLNEEDELFQILFRTPPLRRRQKRNKSEINPQEVRRGKHEAIAFKAKIDEEPVSPRRRLNLGRRPFIPSWPFVPAALLGSRDLEQLDREALEAAIDAQRELLDEEKRIEDMEFINDVEFTSPEIFNDEFRPHPYKSKIDDDQVSSDLEPILEAIMIRSRSPSASPRMVGEEFIPGVPDFAKSVVLCEMETLSNQESPESSRTTSPATVVEVDPESMKFPKPIIKFSPRNEKKSLEYEYEERVEVPVVLNESNAVESPNEAALYTTKDIEPQQNLQQTESSGRSTPLSTTEHSSQSESASSKTKSKSGFPRFIHSVFPLRRSSSEKKRGRSKTRRKPERKVTKQKHKKKSRSISKDKTKTPTLPSIEVTSPKTPSNVTDFPLLPSPPDYSTIVQQGSLTPPVPHDQADSNGVRLPQYDQESLDKIILSESDDAHSETCTTTPDTVRRADAYAELD